MTESSLKNDRRKREERRRVENGPPAGVCERRVNIERRLFNLGVDSGQAWLSKPARDGAELAAGLTKLNAFYDLKTD